MEPEPNLPESRSGAAGPARRLGWTTTLGALLLYAAGLALATFPMVLRLGSALPGGLCDPLTHLWTLRWYKSCLLKGDWPFLCPDLQYPIGAPLGNFPPMHLQALLYLLFSPFTGNDALVYNLIWAFGFLTTGLGTFWLAWSVLKDRTSAVLAGLLAMLSGPMLLHGHGHLEMIQMGTFPLFLLAWMRWIDLRGRVRLLTAAGAYLLVAMSAPYFGVIVVFPAVLYVLFAALRDGRRNAWPWLRSRAGGLLAFSAIVLPGMVLLFASQVWAMAQGVPMERPASLFNLYGAPWWSYLTPTPLHPLGQVVRLPVYEAPEYGFTVAEKGSYLGLVALGLVAYAALARVPFERRAYWWLVLALLVLLSLGASLTVGGVQIPLPAGWLWDVFPPFRFMRVPARFNLFSAVVAALIAGAGLKHLLARLPGPTTRCLTFGALVVLTVADLSMTPFASAPIPLPPTFYAELADRDSRAAFLEVPQYHDDLHAIGLNSICGYWQALHQAPTTAGYSANPNLAYNDRLGRASPFADFRLAAPGYLDEQGSSELELDIVTDARFLDYAWLYLTAHNLRYVVLHRWATDGTRFEPQMRRLEDLLAGAEVIDDNLAMVIDRDRLDRPKAPTLLCTGGWSYRTFWQGRWSLAVADRAELSAYHPEPARELVFSWEGVSFEGPRLVRLLDGDRELARWRVEPEAFRTYQSPPLRLPGGLRELRLEVGEAEVVGRRRRSNDPQRGSLRIATVALRPAEAGASAVIATGKP